MAQERGSAVMSSTAALLLLLLCSDIFHACAITYKVGDNDGWGFGVSGWPNDKTFKDGDVLEFNYLPLLHNVVVVDKKGYESCTAPSGAKTFNSGHDNIKLVKGMNYFLCSFPLHCNFGMKLAISVQ